MKKIFTFFAILCVSATCSLFAQNAVITLYASDVWGDGTGYQMLLDSDANTYGTIIPATGYLGKGDIPASIYDEFEYKIPVNADGALNTSNIVVNDAVTITIPAGTYDFCITNPTPGDTTMWIANTALGRQNDYTFEADKHYRFMVVYNSSKQMDTVMLSVGPVGVDLSATQLSVPAPSCALTSAETIRLQVVNNGTEVITGFTAKYKIGTTGTPVSENVTGISLKPLQGYVYTFTALADLTMPALDSLQGSIELTEDVLSTNNTTPWAYTGVLDPVSTFPYTQNFDNGNTWGWRVLDANQDGATWELNYISETNVVADYFHLSNSTANDWLVSSCFTFAAGEMYSIKFDYAVDMTYANMLGYDGTGAMKVFVGTAQTAAGLTTQIVDLPSISNTDFTSSTTKFKVSSTGTYYIGFNAVTPSANTYSILMLDNIQISKVTGIDNANNDNINLRIYPNPAKDNVVIRSDAAIKQIEIASLAGKVIYSHNVAGAYDHTVNVANFAQGIYIVKTITANGISLQKLNVVK